MEPDLAKLAFAPYAGVLHDLTEDEFPAVVSGWTPGSLELSDAGTHFGFVGSGTARLSFDNHTFDLTEGMYFAVPFGMEISGDGFGFVASRLGYRGFFHLGGPIEDRGRLRYINGCTDSLLIPPLMKGDPCLNLLHVPPHANQAAHTHPSFRVGMIVQGRGICKTPLGSVALTPGLVFYLPGDFLHSFHTLEEPMLIVAWHPDSDCGPTHEEHPMLNRTFVDGKLVDRDLIKTSHGKDRHEVS